MRDGLESDVQAVARLYGKFPHEVRALPCSEFITMLAHLELAREQEERS